MQTETKKKEMNAETFFNKVVKMRKAQKDYFSFKTINALQESKKLEREIDIEIQRVLEIKENRRNPKFNFNRENL